MFMKASIASAVARHLVRLPHGSALASRLLEAAAVVDCFIDIRGDRSADALDVVRRMAFEIDVITDTPLAATVIARTDRAGADRLSEDLNNLPSVTARVTRLAGSRHGPRPVLSGRALA